MGFVHAIAFVENGGRGRDTGEGKKENRDRSIAEGVKKTGVTTTMVQNETKTVNTNQRLLYMKRYVHVTNFLKPPYVHLQRPIIDLKHAPGRPT